MMFKGQIKKGMMDKILGPAHESDGIAAHEGKKDEVHHAISEELINALHARDTHGVSEALKASHDHISSLADRSVVDQPMEDDEPSYS